MKNQLKRPELVGEILLRVDWQLGADRIPESTTVEKLPDMLASISAQGGSLILIRKLETLEA